MFWNYSKYATHVYSIPSTIICTQFDTTENYSVLIQSTLSSYNKLQEILLYNGLHVLSCMEDLYTTKIRFNIVCYYYYYYYVQFHLNLNLIVKIALKEGMQKYHKAGNNCKQLNLVD